MDKPENKKRDVLSNIDIDRFGKRYIPDYRGCFSKDTLPYHVKPGAYVVNLQNSHLGNGSHWMTGYIPENQKNGKNGKKVLYWMDPLSLHEPVAVSEWAEGYLIKRNSFALEDFNGDTCGWWCLWFLTHHPERGFEEINKTFSKNTRENEHILYLWRKKNGFL